MWMCLPALFPSSFRFDFFFTLNLNDWKMKSVYIYIDEVFYELHVVVVWFSLTLQRLNSFRFIVIKWWGVGKVLKTDMWTKRFAPCVWHFNRTQLVRRSGTASRMKQRTSFWWHTIATNKNDHFDIADYKQNNARHNREKHQQNETQQKRTKNRKIWDAVNRWNLCEQLIEPSHQCSRSQSVSYDTNTEQSKFKLFSCDCHLGFVFFFQFLMPLFYATPHLFHSPGYFVVCAIVYDVCMSASPHCHAWMSLSLLSIFFAVLIEFNVKRIVALKWKTKRREEDEEKQLAPSLLTTQQ